MTKRLSEIGCERWAYEEWREWSSFDLTIQEKWGNPEKLILLTPDQRRELVQVVWKTAVRSTLQIEAIDRDIHLAVADARVEQFIKEEGL